MSKSQRGPSWYTVSLQKDARLQSGNESYTAGVDLIYKQSERGFESSDPAIARCVARTREEAEAEASRRADAWIEQHQKVVLPEQAP